MGRIVALRKNRLTDSDKLKTNKPSTAVSRHSALSR